MRSLFGSIVVLALASFAYGQQPTAAALAERAAKVVGEMGASTHKPQIKNSPLSLDEVNESVQTLSDGNRITRSSTTKMYRNSDGRVRREFPGGQGGMLGSVYSTSGAVSIQGAGSGSYTYHLDPTLKTARVIDLESIEKVAAVGKTQLSEADKARFAKAKEELALNRVEVVRMSDKMGEMRATLATAAIPAMAPVPMVMGDHSSVYFGTQGKFDTRSEELGTRDFEGVSAEGTRRTTTIPAGAIGNERPIEIVYERWFSKELGLVVHSKNSDPRFGEQTYRIANLTRAEPDPALFSVPTEYRRLDKDGMFTRVGTGALTAKPVATVDKRRP